MPLSIGTRLGPYEISGKLGAGGMGEVYRAKDTRLKREVALKVLPDFFAGDPDRMARFQREAEVLASLNHPNIGSIYGLEESDGVRALAMELVEGPTLADCIARGPMPLKDALPIGKQIAEALEYAHEKGIIHRDLKPANVKITPEGRVKVLDFGLAKLLANETALADPTISPTMTMRATMAGVIMGTAAYMSPEQASGKPVDKRADIWSFGVVLWEMLTGKRLFDGETVSHTLADVLRGPIDLDRLPDGTPVAVRELLRRCMDRDVKNRLRDIGEARVLLENPHSVASGFPASLPPRRPFAWMALSAFLLLALAALAAVHFRPASPPQQRRVRLQVPPPGKSDVRSFQLSPDGSYLAFTAPQEGRTLLFVRPLDSLESQVLPGTDDATHPFWSPDSASIGFFAQGKLKRIALTGGPPQTLCNAYRGGGGTWNGDGEIVFAGLGTPLSRVPATGGVPAPIAKLVGRFPKFLPDGRRFLFSAYGAPENSGIYVGSLDAAPPTRILPDLSNAAYTPAGASGRGGYLLFRREGTLMAQRFDPDRLRLTGDIFPLAEQVAPQLGGYGPFTVSDNGVLAYRSGAQVNQLVWMDRTGAPTQSVGSPGEFNNFRLSPDEKRIAFDRTDAQSSNLDIWTLDMARGVASRLTSDLAVDNLPIWSPDGLRILFPSRRSGAFDLFIKSATGAGQEELLIKLGTPTGWGTDWSRDGRFVMYQIPDPRTGQDLWISPQSGDRKPFPYLQTQFDEQEGRFSPDGHWVAYVSDETGSDEIYVQAFPLSGGKWRISSGGGSEPEWRKDGLELFYVAADQNLMAVSIKLGSTVDAGKAKSLFPVPVRAFRRSYAVSGDGQRFLTIRPAGETHPITVVLNWQAGLHK